MQWDIKGRKATAKGCHCTKNQHLIQWNGQEATSQRIKIQIAIQHKKINGDVVQEVLQVSGFNFTAFSFGSIHVIP